ncbi:alpha/beta fold hydrolase [Lentilactobacillus sp. Marseille-Q4993]|uniref:alpha/beta hydrolase n=1 Tax=Lentilactobacillus sp. Marseille-Q4993 TaxID=3039492 RepID=UPI0024BCADCC|nr:alpha/beta fold hydrolase [Lentilactobacillus sp. Marseille-Q4993]
MPQPGTFFFEHGKKGIILMHAFASGPIDVRLLARRLEKLDYSVYAPLLTGHGTPDFMDIINQGSPEKWWQGTQDAVSFMKEKGMEQISIFGISLGGIFAAKALESFPELVGGGSFGSPIVREGPSTVHNTFIKMARANYVAYKTDPSVMAEKLEWLDNNIDSLLADISTFTLDVSANLDKIQVPYFIGQGLADEIVDPQSGRNLNNRLKNTSVSFHEYPDASHMITVNSAHQQLEQDLSLFLENIYK